MKTKITITALIMLTAIITAAYTQETQNLNFQNWYTWGVRALARGNTVTLNGNVNTAGYVTERLSTNMRGRTIILQIQNIEASAFSGSRLFKITVNRNDELVVPENVQWLEEGEYIPCDYNMVEFILPNNFDGKLGFVFYQAELKDFVITATYR